jgi:hypothetical protein
MKLIKEEVQLMANKSDAGLVFDFDKRDIVKLVSNCWKESFAKVGTNKKSGTYQRLGTTSLSCSYCFIE